MHVVTQQYDTLDLLCWRHKRQTAGLVESVLEAHPGLAEQGPFLPHGILIELPDQAPQSLARPLLQLWD